MNTDAMNTDAMNTDAMNTDAVNMPAVSTDAAQGPVVGVDGWGDGWIVALAHGRQIRWSAYPQPRTGPRDAFARLLRDHPTCTVAVDIPIGVTAEPRRSDRGAQDWLREGGRGTWQSIFPTPSASVLDAFERGRTHAEAMVLERAAGRPGTSIQAWNLLAKIVEVREALEALEALQAFDTVSGPTVVEAHPECSLRRLDARIGTASKKTGRGAGLRLRALATAFDLPDLADAPAGVPVDDLLDAVAVAWTAQRLAAGAHDLLTFPADPAPGEPHIHV